MKTLKLVLETTAAGEKFFSIYADEKIIKCFVESDEPAARQFFLNYNPSNAWQRMLATREFPSYTPGAFAISSGEPIMTYRGITITDKPNHERSFFGILQDGIPQTDHWDEETIGEVMDTIDIMLKEIDEEDQTEEQKLPAWREKETERIITTIQMRGKELDNRKVAITDLRQMITNLLGIVDEIMNIAGHHLGRDIQERVGEMSTKTKEIIHK